MRKPAVAGMFYEGSEASLRRQIETCFLHRIGPGLLPDRSTGTSRSILGLISPHAGYLYSGPVAAHGFYRLALETKPEVIVILGPNHRGIGGSIAVGKEREWHTPLGSVQIDRELGDSIVSAFHGAQQDDSAHTWEHSIEVQLPFLQYIYEGDFRFLPIALSRQDFSTSQGLGQAIAAALTGKEGVIIASSDFTHYESQSSASKKDKLALEAILDMNPQQLENTVNAQGITMCGFGPIMTMLVACKLLGAGKANLLRYATSGDITGDLSQVVGYASVEVTT